MLFNVEGFVGICTDFQLQFENLTLNQYRIRKSILQKYIAVTLPL